MVRHYIRIFLCHWWIGGSYVCIDKLLFDSSFSNTRNWTPQSRIHKKQKRIPIWFFGCFLFIPRSLRSFGESFIIYLFFMESTYNSEERMVWKLIMEWAVYVESQTTFRRRYMFLWKILSLHRKYKWRFFCLTRGIISYSTR